MTIVVGVAAPDGLILAADSRMTYTPDGAEGRTRVASDYTQKVFSVCGRFGVACYGAGFVEDKTIAGQMADFEALLGKPKPDLGLDEFASGLRTFFEDRVRKDLAAAGTPWKRGDKWRLGFLVAGYDTAGIVGYLRDVRVPEAGGPWIFPSGPSTSNVGPTWRGQDDVLNRLMAGVDSDLLVASGVHVPEDLEEALAGLEYNVMRPITTQDAVDCAVFLIETTIGMQRFHDGTRARPGGVPGCGGPIRILHIARGAVEWISRPTVSAASASRSGDAAIR